VTATLHQHVIDVACGPIPSLIESITWVWR